MGFTQRQAGGKFTRDEADAFIEQLETAAHDGAPMAATGPAAAANKRAKPARATDAQVAADTRVALDDVPAEELAAELQRRGWIVVEP